MTGIPGDPEAKVPRLTYLGVQAVTGKFRAARSPPGLLLCSLAFLVSAHVEGLRPSEFSIAFVLFLCC